MTFWEMDETMMLREGLKLSKLTVRAPRVADLEDGHNYR